MCVCVIILQTGLSAFEADIGCYWIGRWEIIQTNIHKFTWYCFSLNFRAVSAQIQGCKEFWDFKRYFDELLVYKGRLKLQRFKLSRQHIVFAHRSIPVVFCELVIHCSWIYFVVFFSIFIYFLVSSFRQNFFLNLKRSCELYCIVRTPNFAYKIGNGKFKPV